MGDSDSLERHRCLYKSQFTYENDQEKRRLILLENQKRDRDIILDFKRSLTECLKEDDSDDNEGDEDSKMDYSLTKRKCKQRCNMFINLLISSEWMRDRPHDIEDNWLFVFCPKGQRVIVHTWKGTTKMYNKRGKIVKVFSSILPGGNKSMINYYATSNSVTLDCIYCKTSSTIYILDFIYWGKHLSIQTDTEFRQFFLRSRITEICPTVDKEQLNNHIPMIFLNYYSCTMPSMRHALNNYSDAKTELDGLLFYHKQASWTPDPTPLVLWTKPFMLRELFGPDISENPVLYKYPKDYLDYHTFIEQFEVSKKLKKKMPDKDNGEDMYVDTCMS